MRCIKRDLTAKARDRHVFVRGLAWLVSTFAKAQKSLGFAECLPPDLGPWLSLGIPGTVR